MKARQKPPAGRGGGGSDIKADVYDALRSLGWIAPQCDEDVRRAEQEAGARPVELPEALQDARAVLRGDRSADEPRARTLPLPGDPGIDSTLARAAREGGHVPPEIEEAMRRDRQAAERDADHGGENAKA